MSLSSVVQKWKDVQQSENWYALHKDFPWDIKELQQIIFHYFGSKIDVPVVFCDTCDANRILDMLGEEESELQWYMAGIFEADIIFIFHFDEWLPLLETLFHEHRHVWQYHNPEFKPHFDTDKKLPYQERITEIDAFSFAKEKLHKYIKDIAQIEN